MEEQLLQCHELMPAPSPWCRLPWEAGAMEEQLLQCRELMPAPSPWCRLAWEVGYSAYCDDASRLDYLVLPIDGSFSDFYPTPPPPPDHEGPEQQACRAALQRMVLEHGQ